MTTTFENRCVLKKYLIVLRPIFDNIPSIFHNHAQNDLYQTNILIKASTMNYNTG